MTVSRKSLKNTVFLLGIILLIIGIGVFLSKSTSTISKETSPQASQGPEKGSTLAASDEAELKKYYQDEKKVDLGSYSARYSVFENSSLGYRFKYPVGFNAQDENGNVVLSNNGGKRSIIVIVKNHTFEVTPISSTDTPNGNISLEDATEFIKKTFEFIPPVNYSQKQLQERFSQGNGNVGKY